jgi:hypothetical protein
MKSKEIAPETTEYISNYSFLEDIDKELTNELNNHTAFDFEPDFQKRLETFLLNPEKKIEEDKFLISISTDKETGVFDVGNFSIITGQQKSRKTFLLSIIASSYLKPKENIVNVVSMPPEDKPKILYFDTEQSERDAQRVQHRILKLANLEKSENLNYFNLRGAEIEIQLSFIIECIEKIKNVGFVIIDGIADLLPAVNDESAAKLLVRKLMDLTQKNSIHITAVLHQNKGSETLSGWLGSDVVRKASAVIKVSRCKELPNKRSVVSCMDLRSSENFTDFTFEIGENGLPFSVENFKQKARLPINLILEREQIATVVKLAHKDEISLTEFRNNLELELKRCAKDSVLNIEFTARRFSDFIEYLKLENIVILQTKGTS